MDTKCCVKVSPNDRYGSFHPHQCDNPPKVERDGKTYCTIHDPEYIKAKEEIRQSKLNARSCPCGYGFYGNEGRRFSFCPMCGTRRTKG